ncbi:MAG: tRNA (adenosine(37)-N6)-threonylcarbamoyltransferase complex dimerization subunit type 1 TsaB [Solirubrobacteraceae bacterium]
MRILALDTATSATAVALVDVDVDVDVAPAPPTTRLGGRAAIVAGPYSAPAAPHASHVSLEARDDPPAGARPRHAQRLLALCAELADQAGGLQTVQRIAVGIGPGTFTGLRIGIATAHALARSLSVPLVGVCTLQALAVQAREAHDRPILSLIDARRGELFAAGWAREADPRRDRATIEPRVLPPDRLAEALEALRGAGRAIGETPRAIGETPRAMGETPRAIGDSPLAIGDGAVRFRAALEHHGAEIAPDASMLNRVRAGAHCLLGAVAERVAADAVRPLYLRAPDAEIARSGARIG